MVLQIRYHGPIRGMHEVGVEVDILWLHEGCRKEARGEVEVGDGGPCRL